MKHGWVVHCKEEPFDVMIDRSTKWGNPFMIGRDGNREEVISKYRSYIMGNRELLDSLPELRDKALGCWCYPQSCHGDVLVELIHLLPFSNMFKYAGIGSRSTPPEILKAMDLFANSIARDSILRTGAAPGADQAFEFGAILGGGLVEIYLPWKGFEGRQDGIIVEPGQDAMEIAEHYHPGWKYLKQGARKLIARNGYQVLGPDLYDPVEMVICWTPDGSLDGEGSKVGGTGQALRIAADYDIPVLNIQRPDHLAEIESFFL